MHLSDVERSQNWKGPLHALLGFATAPMARKENAASKRPNVKRLEVQHVHILPLQGCLSEDAPSPQASLWVIHIEPLRG